MRAGVAAAEAFDRGASLLTHAFNAMPGLEHRAPGPAGAALNRDHVVLEVIADGSHVHPTVIRTLCATAPGRVALVTDAMSAPGSATAGINSVDSTLMCVQGSPP
ncbi:hypothetical protein [Microbacterium sp. MYb66]|uniref:hypothetical protein n=1 Tax=Microbacterium sp. MYb66 TaxID=1848692 RepID=UPI0015E2E13D